MMIVGWNMPGYLPEMEPIRVENLHEAVQVLDQEINDRWDFDYEGAVDEAERLEIDGIWLRAQAALMLTNEVGMAVFVDERNLVMWIAEAEDEDA
jgi:adenosyl cobinamide kinase/adenosyl cobinamide phosphate guanylyltransferase